MGLNYNPSSFATNKTILEAIEELKKYLQTTPLACIYSLEQVYFNINILTYNKTNVDNPNDQELKLGDIIIANDYFGFIESMDETTITIDQWRAIGVNIQSITVIDHIINFENIPAGATPILIAYPAPSPWDYQRLSQIEIEIKYYDGFHLDGSGNPVLQTDTEFVTVGGVNAIWSTEDPITHDITIYVDVIDADFNTAINSFTIPAGATGQPGADGNDGVSITGATIDGSNHLILTLSDGNTIDAGALPTPSEYTHTVSITTTSGTFSDDDFAKLGYGDSVIKYTDAYNVTTVYKLKIETASILEFEAIDATSRNSLKLIDVNKTTKAYSMTSIAMITSSTISSGSATSGKVLTANGSGGTSWETAGGGGSTLNQYHFTPTGITDILNIVQNAKGNVMGRISVNTVVDGYATFALCAGIGGPSNNLLVLSGAQASSNSMFIFYLQYNTSNSTTTKNLDVITTATMTTTHNPSGWDVNYSGSTIFYWNDTQLHS